MKSYNYNKEAYNLLCRCSELKDFTKWAKWKKDYKKEVYLEHADLKDKYLKHVDLSHVHLSHAMLDGADLQEANLQRAWLKNAHLKKAHLYRANFKDANIGGARLQSANMIEADLRGADLKYTFLDGANLHHAYLHGSNFSYSIVNGETLIDTEKVDINTLFTGVGLSSARVKPGLEDTLIYNIRRRRWEDFYDKGNIIARLFKKTCLSPFWRLSNYGRSTFHIVTFFFTMVAVFSVLYWNNPEVLNNYEIDGQSGKLYRAICFSIVTMITLGFSDMNAAPNSFFGNIAVTMQIISGYVILAALVTRISVLFNSNGPAIPLKRERKKFS